MAAEKVFVIITTIENANFAVLPTREDKHYIEYGIKVSWKYIEKHIQNIPWLATREDEASVVSS